MDFTFDDDQRLFQQTVRDFLEAECTPEHLRACWEAGRSHSPELWARLAELGLPGLLVPEEHEGMGMDEISAVLLFEEVGRAALPEPLVATAAVAVPLLRELDAELSGPWLKRITVGEAVVAVDHPASPLVSDADVAGLLLLGRAGVLYAAEPGAVTLEHQPGNDPSRRLFSVELRPEDATPVAEGERARTLRAAALDRGALAAAAGQLGVAERLVSLAGAYAQQRHQFGRPIGSFQAVKHMLADALVRLEYARPAVYRAAHSVARGATRALLHVSMAKVAACDAAAFAARIALQVHGAIGYTWEQDLHIWMRRAWSLDQAWGRAEFHRRRVEEAVLEGGLPLGPGETFEGD